MKVIDFLKLMDPVGLQVIYYEDEDPLWEGCLFDTPYWVGEMELDIEGADFHEPISFQEDLGEKYQHKCGLVISVTEKEE